MEAMVENKIAGSRRGLHILVVEDDENSREMMADLLALNGKHSIEVAASAEDGLEHMRSDAAYDLVFTDIGLPGMSGLEMVDCAVKAGLLTVDRFVVCSAYTALKPEIAALGAQCIPKPVDADKIASMVASFAEGRHKK
jgi:two-component system, NtrC family, response regulator AtoC